MKDNKQTVPSITQQLLIWCHICPIGDLHVPESYFVVNKVLTCRDLAYAAVSSYFAFTTRIAQSIVIFFRNIHLLFQNIINIATPRVAKGSIVVVLYQFFHALYTL